MITIGEMKLFSVRELSERFDLSEQSIRQYIKAGKLQGNKMGNKWYVSEEAIKTYFLGKHSD